MVCTDFFGVGNIGFHRGWCGLRQQDDSAAHHGEGGRRHGQHGRADGELLAEQPDAQRDADDRVDDDQEGLRSSQRPDMQRRLLQKSATTLPAARAYTGQWANIPATPNWASVSVVALMNVATRAHMTAAAEAYSAARKPGDPQCAKTAKTAAPAQHASPAASQCWPTGLG